MHSKKHSAECTHDTCSNDEDIKKIATVLVIIFLFMVLELWGHWKTNSLSLLADSLHLLVDIAGFVVSLVALKWAKKPANNRMTFGYHRIEVLGALVSIILIWAAVGYLMIESLHKYVHPKEIDGKMFFLIAVVGFFVNCVCIYALHYNEYSHKPKHKNLNIRAAHVHIVGDLIQSVGVIIAGSITYLFPSYTIVDIFCTVVFAVGVLISTGFVLRDAIAVLAESSPSDVDLDELKKNILDVENVFRIHDINLWMISANINALSVKVLADDILISDYENILRRINLLVKERYGIQLCTVQVDTPNTFDGEAGFIVEGLPIEKSAPIEATAAN